MKDIIKSIAALEKEIDTNDKVIKEKFDYRAEPADPGSISIQRELQRMEPSVLDFYERMNGIGIKWKAADPGMLPYEMTGSIKINSLSQVVRDWSGVVFFDN